MVEYLLLGLQQSKIPGSPESFEQKTPASWKEDGQLIWKYPQTLC